MQGSKNEKACGIARVKNANAMLLRDIEVEINTLRKV
jgi:hypothetical protein